MLSIPKLFGMVIYMKGSKFIIGIDEVGRGPLAGPVGVGAALVPVDFDWQKLPGVTDSKQLSQRKREEIAQQARQLQAAGQCTYTVAMVSAPVIDRIGIVSAINLAMQRGLRRALGSDIAPAACHVKLDGGLQAPAIFTQQETIIKGDAKEPAIGLASIVAKVARDRYMTRLAGRAAYQPYDFHTHKGYGTKAHRAAIATHGLSNQHRQSYCKNVVLL